MNICATALHIPLASGIVQTVITSPPYYGLRDYGVPGQLGLERTPEAYIANMVAVFREVRRVLRDDGVMWLNVGDSYASQGGPEPVQTRNPHRNGGSDTLNGGNSRHVADGLKPKDLIGIPWMLAFALRADGWYLRSDIIWSKPNPMPESVTDRPTKSHEYLFMLTKKAHYFWDQEAVRENVTGNTHDRGTKLSPPKEAANTADGNGHKDWTKFTPDPVTSRNCRTVWEITPQPTRFAHFATFPEALVERCIRAGTSERGCCPKCGKAWVRVVERDKDKSEREPHGKALTSPRHDGNTWNENSGRGFMPVEINTLDWRPACTCDAGDPVPCLVFDPFLGSGTTARVAIRLGRRAVGTELSWKYLTEIVPVRTTVQAGLQGIA